MEIITRSHKANEIKMWKLSIGLRKRRGMRKRRMRKRGMKGKQEMRKNSNRKIKKRNT